jgi:hypothetical protein
MQLRGGIKDLQVDGAEPKEKDPEIILSTEGFAMVRFRSIKRSHVVVRFLEVQDNKHMTA